jgi:hypothetical protein
MWTLIMKLEKMMKLMYDKVVEVRVKPTVPQSTDEYP